MYGVLLAPQVTSQLALRHRAGPQSAGQREHDGTSGDSGQSGHVGGCVGWLPSEGAGR